MKQIGILILVCLVALSGVGVAYALWSDSIDINGSVRTSGVSAIFQQAVTNDPHTPVTADPSAMGNWNGWTFGPLSPTAWTGGARSTVESSAFTSVTGQGTGTLTLTVGSAYTGYWGSAGCTILNTGSLPIKVDSVIAVVTPPAGRTTADVTVKFTGALDQLAHAQVEPGNEILGGIYFQWNSLPSLASNYGLEVSVKVSQFNPSDNPDNDWSQVLFINGILSTRGNTSLLMAAAPGLDATAVPAGLYFSQAASNDPLDQSTLDPVEAGAWNWANGDLSTASWAGQRSATYTAGWTSVSATGTPTLSITISPNASSAGPGYSSVGCTLINSGTADVKISGMFIRSGNAAGYVVTPGGALVSDTVIAAGSEMLGWLNFSWAAGSLENTFTVTIEYAEIAN